MVGGDPGGCRTTFGSVGTPFYGAMPMRMQCLLRVSYLHVTGRSNLSWGLIFALGACGFPRLPTCCALKPFALGIIGAFDDRKPCGANNTQREHILAPKRFPLKVSRPYRSRGKRGELEVTARIHRTSPT